jgi:ectoine hydroxylase-related dioxygenase (phytanoyl-CoA dioxygenase family)
MTPDDILSHPPRVLSQAQRELFFREGYLLVENAIPDTWIERLRAARDELVERSRAVAESDAVYDLEPGHSRASPRLRRITNPSVQHPVIWDYASRSILPDIVADLVGPDVKFLDTMLNFKWPGGGAEIKWHQDVPFFPHTNYAILTTGTLLEDVGPEQAPMGVVPGSHEGPVYDLYDDEGVWTGTISDADLQNAGLDRAVHLTGPAGSVQVHSCRTLHGSARNESDSGRPILLSTYAAADAFPYVPYPALSEQSFHIVRGQPARAAHLDPRPCPVPPDWSQGKGYQSIFTWQQKESTARRHDGV